MEGLETALFLSGAGGVRMGNAEEGGGEGRADVKTQTNQWAFWDSWFKGCGGKDAGGTSPRSLSSGRAVGTALSIWIAHDGSPDSKTLFFAPFDLLFVPEIT